MPEPESPPTETPQQVETEDLKARLLKYDLPERRNDVLLGGWTGTSLAGGIFGILLFFWELVLTDNLPSYFETFAKFMLGIGQLLGGSCLGFFIGFVWAGGIGVFVCFGALIVLLTLGTSHTPFWVASCIGAWTAFLCCGGFEWVPIILGQLGATVLAHKYANQKTQRIFKTALPPTPSRFGLGQLFRAMTLLSLFFALISLIKPSSEFLIEMGYCLLWQSATVPMAIRLLNLRTTKIARST